MILAVIMLFTLCACSNDTPDTEEPVTTTTAKVTVPTVPRIDKDISSLFTAEELTDIIGVPMQEPKVSGQSATLTSYAVDSYTSRVIIDIQEQSLDVFLQSVSLWYSDLTEARNLGQSAWFSPSFNHLVIFDDGHMFTIDFAFDGYDDADTNLLICRDIAVTLLERY